MATTGKTYLDSDGLTTLIGKIKTHIKNQAADKVQALKYDGTNKQLQWSKDGKNWSNIDVKTWVKDIYLNSIGLSASGVITLTLNEAGNNDEKKIDLKTWFNPANYLTTTGAASYLTLQKASSTYLSKSDATNIYITTITSISDVADAWNAVTVY